MMAGEPSNYGKESLYKPAMGKICITGYLKLHSTGFFVFRFLTQRRRKRETKK
jgi:hypothetical protein